MLPASTIDDKNVYFINYYTFQNIYLLALKALKYLHNFESHAKMKVTVKTSMENTTKPNINCRFVTCSIMDDIH